MKVEIRSDHVEVSGYVNAVDRDSRPLADRNGYFVEKIKPGAFARSIARHDPVMLLNHDQSRVLSDRKRGLVVREDAVGLYAVAQVYDKDVIAKARAGRLSGWSFGFVPVDQDEKVVDGMRHRTVRDLNLLEVSLLDDTRTPAYIATSVMTRDDMPDEEIQLREMPDEVRITQAETPAEPTVEPETPTNDVQARCMAVEALEMMWLDE